MRRDTRFIFHVHPLLVTYGYNCTLYLHYDPSEEEDTSSVISLSDLLSHAELLLATIRKQKRCKEG
jgi:hypothetical protein